MRDAIHLLSLLLLLTPLPSTLAEYKTMPEPRYGGIYTPKEPDDPVDPKPAIEKTCEPNCAGVWATYKKCEVRIEEKGRGECSGFYMDYFKCIDHCAHKKLFNSLE